MGVHGLWELLSPVGHRVSNDSVRNKILAVDISIWLTQFVKAMRDAEGAQVRNSHLLGVFRRCVKLLYLSVKPVLVFDGATPALKRRTLSSRRAQREKHAAKLRRLAERMLLNRIKQSTVSHAIAKQRNGRQRRASITRKKSSSLPSESRHTPHDLEKYGPTSENSADDEIEAIQLPETSDRRTTIGEKQMGGQDHMVTSDVPYEDSDSDDMQISIPQNVDDLDDEVLMKLPTKLQTEVFKQVKLEQRARHRENMTQKQQGPSEFSKMQIEGFLRHTALNRKISRVRNVINSKTGASQRIASDSGRNFILEEEPFMRMGRGIEASASDDEGLEIGARNTQSGDDDKFDLLANIRARKEAIFQRADDTRAQPKEKLMPEPRHGESGTGWASKVLEGNGNLTMTPKIPGNTEAKDESEFVSRVDDDSDVRREVQLRLPTKIRDDSRANRFLLVKEKSTVDNSTSDGDEWEDGDQPIQYDFTIPFDKDTGRSDAGPSKFNGISEKEEHPKLLELLSKNPFSQKGEDKWRGHDLSEYHEATHEFGPEDTMDETATRRSDLVVPKCMTDEVKVDIQHLDSTIPAPFQSTSTAPGGSAAQRREEYICEENKKGNLNSFIQETLEGDNAVEVQRSNITPSRDDSTRAQCPADSLRLDALAQARTTPAQDPAVKSVSFVCSKEVSSRGRRCEPRKRSTSRSIEEGIKAVPSTLTRKGAFVGADDAGSPSCKSMVPASQATKEVHTEMAGLEGHAGPSDSSRLCKPILPSSSQEEPSNSQEQGSGYVQYDEQPKKGVSTIRSNADSSESIPEGLNRRAASGQTEAHQLSFAQLESMQEKLEGEAREIKRQRSLHQGGADSVADEMYAETRDLIKLFGIPYLEAPMEAEAQCAFLNKERIVDGVLTEDSDAFLFGAVTVYRQLFVEGRFAEAYDVDDIQRSLGLDREKLIRLAYLLGSDYTAGVRGVGIVNSMEILEAFPGSSGLEEFREWTNSVTVLDREPEEEVMSGTSQEAVRRRFCWKHRNMKRNWEVREGFPSLPVFEAYMNPVVDISRERFTWGPVNFEGLAKFCWEKFGWEKDKFDSTVGPLRQQLRERSGMTQRRIDEFFKPHRFAKIRSERLQNAVHGMAGDSAQELMGTHHRTRGRRKINPVTFSTELSDHSSHEVDDPVDIDKTNL